MINLQNTDHKCFQYAVTVALTQESIEHTQKNYERLTPSWTYTTEET